MSKSGMSTVSGGDTSVSELSTGFVEGLRGGPNQGGRTPFQWLNRIVASMTGLEETRNFRDAYSDAGSEPPSESFAELLAPRH